MTHTGGPMEKKTITCYANPVSLAWLAGEDVNAQTMFCQRKTRDCEVEVKVTYEVRPKGVNRGEIEKFLLSNYEDDEEAASEGIVLLSRIFNHGLVNESPKGAVDAQQSSVGGSAHLGNGE